MFRWKTMVTGVCLLGVFSVVTPQSKGQVLLPPIPLDPEQSPLSDEDPLTTTQDLEGLQGEIDRSDLDWLPGHSGSLYAEEMEGTCQSYPSGRLAQPRYQAATGQPPQYFHMMIERCRVPGWERARSEDWMDLGRLQRMTTQIARSGDMDLYFGLNSVGRPQYLQQHNVVDSVGPNSVTPGPLAPGIQTPYGQLVFLADFNRAIEVYFDIFIASRPHEDNLQGDEGFMLFRRLPGPLGESELATTIFEVVNVKAGEFEMDFGDAHYRRSNNADVQRNPLIGNYVIDPRATDIGFEVFNPKDSLPINWLAGVGVGNTGDFQTNRGWQTHAKLWAETTGRLRPSVSFFYVDNASNPTGFPNGGSKSDLFRSNRSGGPYADVFGGGNAPGQVTPGNGQLVTAAQFDLTWIESSWEFYGNFGSFADADTNGSAPGTPTESWFYYAAESVFRCTPRSYVAARYTVASARRLVSSVDPTRDVNSNGFVHRFQLGGGYWLHDLILLKLEYVHQFYEGFSADGSQVSGVDVWLNPRFDGALMEVSFTF